MADIRIKDLSSASSSASDDFIAIDGTTNGTRKLNAFSPTFGGNATVTGTLTVSGTSAFVGANTGSPYVLIKGGSSGTNGGGSLVVENGSGGSVIGIGNVSAIAGGAYNNDPVVWYAGSESLRFYNASTEVANFSSTGVLNVLSTTASTTTSTGALVVSGGVGVGGAINGGGLFDFAVSANSTQVYTIQNTSTGASAATRFTLVGGSSSGSIQLYGSGHSTPNILQYASPDTHKWQCNGVERASLSSAGVLSLLATTASTSTSSGALVVSGGVGVAKSLNVGEAVTVAGGSFAAASFYKSASLGTVLSGATGSSYDLYLTNPAGNYVMQVPTGTRNAEFAATLTTVGAITSGASISTSAPTGGAGAWELGVYSSTAPSATGYVTIEIGGTVYKLLASNV